LNESQTKYKDKLIRLIILAMTAAMVALFFASWVTVSEYVDELAVFSANYSPWQLANGVEFPYYDSYPILFIMLALPVLLAVLSIMKMPFKRLVLIAIAGILTLTLFNMHFAFGIDYRGDAASAPMFWLAVIVNVATLAVLTYGAKLHKESNPTENVFPPYKQQQKLATASILLAFAVVIAMFAITIPVGGVPALRISFAGIFNNTTAILFGPMYGGLARGLQDMLNHFINPMGAFLWPITLVAFARGAATGWMWLKVRNVKPRVYSVVYATVFAAILAFGLFNLAMQLFAPESAYILAITPREGQGLFFATAYYVSSWGLIVAGLIGLIPQIVVYKVSTKNENHKFYDRFIKFLVAVMVPGLIFNSVNSLILFFTAVSPAAMGRGFVYWWAPRFFEEIITSMIIVYIMVVLMEVYEKAMKRKIVQG